MELKTLLTGEAMDNTDRSAGERFIKNLTGAGTKEIQGYLAEIKADRDFRQQLEDNRRKAGSGRYSAWGIGVGSPLAAVLYTLGRLRKPGIVVETGVASGISSSYFLLALERAGHGELYSIDRDKQSGWLIPDYLRRRWHLVEGLSSEKLGPVLEKLGRIDVFFHDSGHSYENMYREFRLAWDHLRAGGLLLSHNIDMSDAFPAFCRETGVTGYTLEETGGIVKK